MPFMKRIILRYYSCGLQLFYPLRTVFHTYSLAFHTGFQHPPPQQDCVSSAWSRHRTVLSSNWTRQGYYWLEVETQKSVSVYSKLENHFKVLWITVWLKMEFSNFTKPDLLWESARLCSCNNGGICALPHPQEKINKSLESIFLQTCIIWFLAIKFTLCKRCILFCELSQI